LTAHIHIPNVAISKHSSCPHEVHETANDLLS
jgi:hypothetical protein